MIEALQLFPPRRTILALAAGAFLGLTHGHANVDFVHSVVPILKEHCGDCHSGEESKGGFSINTRELFLDDDTAVPGDADASYFIELILEKDPDFMMPPEKKERVPSEHLAVLKQWVNEGMKWEPGFTGVPYEPPRTPPSRTAHGNGRS